MPPCAFFHHNVHVKDPLSVEVEVAGRAKFNWNLMDTHRYLSFGLTVPKHCLISDSLQILYSETNQAVNIKGRGVLLWAKSTPSTYCPGEIACYFKKIVCQDAKGHTIYVLAFRLILIKLKALQ